MDMDGKELLKLMRNNDWEEVRVEGSHHIMKKGNKEISVPVHGSKSIKKGLLNKILKDAGLK
ncbi:MAG: type II toxin-antitoxin system HicA family toxin [Lachnospiraceae bacterium]|nr:type II toxin-antitoxin system HicA family toxin [Lachnospiraceae bacterium]